MDGKVVLFQVRILFKIKDKDSIYYKIVTDTQSCIDEFINRLKSLEDIEKISCEYLCEYDCSRLGEIINVFNGGDINETCKSDE